MQRSHQNASVLILTCSIRRTNESWMSHLFSAVEWTRFSPLRGIFSSQPLPIIFPMCAASSLPSVWCPSQCCSCPNPRPPPPSLPCCRRPKEEGERAARPAAQVVFPLARVFLHTPWLSSSPVLYSHDGICNFAAWWQQKRRRKEGGDTVIAVIATGSFARFLGCLKG
jgi:hypothetical protein